MRDLRDCRGQALVEFAVTIIACLALVFGVIEISRIMLCYTTVANAARIGARYAITNSSAPGATVYYGDVANLKTNVTTIVQNFARAGTLNTSSAYLSVLVSFPDSATPTNPCTGTGSTSTCSNTTAGNRVSVTVSYTYDPLLTYFSLGTINLTSTSQGVITW